MLFSLFAQGFLFLHEDLIFLHTVFQGSNWTEDCRCLRALVGVAEAPGTVTRCLDLERQTTEGRKGLNTGILILPSQLLIKRCEGGQQLNEAQFPSKENPKKQGRGILAVPALFIIRLYIPILFCSIHSILMMRVLTRWCLMSHKSQNVQQLTDASMPVHQSTISKR